MNQNCDCTETPDSNHLLHSKLQNQCCTMKELLVKERRCLANPNYLTMVQKGRITPHMRRITLDWMFELVDAIPDVDMSVYPAACSIFDRYLSNQAAEPPDLQDIALSAILYISKMYEDNPIKITFIENYYRINRLRLIEDQFENVLKIDRKELILPSDYFKRYYLDTRMCDLVGSDGMLEILQHSYNLLPVFYLEYECIIHPPSVIAGACVLESVSRLFGDATCFEFLAEICQITGIHVSYLLKATKDLRKFIQKILHGQQM